MENETASTPPQPRPARNRRVIAGASLVAAGLVGGAVLASSLGASADTQSPTATTSAGSPAAPNVGGPKPVRSDEKQVTGSAAATLKAAALKAVPGGKVVRVETDAGDAAYEVHMTKADGTPVTVKFDKGLKYLRVEAGMGKGDPAGGGRGGPGGPGGTGGPGGPGGSTGSPTSGT
jgi:hypothetical protein